MPLDSRTCAATDGNLWTVRERRANGGLFHRRRKTLVFQCHWMIVELADYPSNWEHMDDESLLSLVPRAKVERAD